MAAKNFDQFAKAIVSVVDSRQDIKDSQIKFNSVLSGLNYGLTYGTPTLPESELTGIRNGDGFVYFMVGQDQVGSEARVYSGVLSA